KPGPERTSTGMCPAPATDPKRTESGELESEVDHPHARLAGRSEVATTLSFPPQRAQSSISMPNTRFSRRAQLIATRLGVGGWTESVTGPVRCGAPMPRSAGVTAARSLLRGANTPW
ncbi:MAG: hypothetical protein ACK2UO_10655, partial [Caldilineaceae bacterium]